MTMSPTARHRARYLVPLAAAAITAGVVFIPQAASGAQHPRLPARTAAQLLASLEQAKTPEFSGTTVETARLGLPSLNDVNLPGGISPDGGSAFGQVVTLLTGSHTAQLAYGGPERQRVAIFLSDLSETDIVHNGNDIWTYSSDSNAVTHKVLAPEAADQQPAPETTPLDPTKSAEQALAKIDPSTTVSVDRTAEVAGRSAYQLVLTPRDPRTLIGSIRIAIDSKTSLPLRTEIWSRKNSKDPAFSVGFTSISMKAPGASTFAFSKPPTAKLEPFTLSSPNSSNGPQAQLGNAQHAVGGHLVGKDWTSVFVEKLSTPSTSSNTTPDGKPCQAVLRNSTSGSTTKKAVPCNGNPPVSIPSLTQSLNELATAVPGGHLLTTSLATVLITDDNRILVGAVTPQYIQQVAASPTAQTFKESQ